MSPEPAPTPGLRRKGSRGNEKEIPAINKINQLLIEMKRMLYFLQPFVCGICILMMWMQKSSADESNTRFDEVRCFASPADADLISITLALVSKDTLHDKTRHLKPFKMSDL